MTEEERNAEGLDESIEDLEAPAAAQDDVVGGATVCSLPTCSDKTSAVSSFCKGITCSNTSTKCQLDSGAYVTRAY